MRHCRLDVVTAARNCLHERKNCPKSCPLLQEENCQNFIFREIIKMYEEMEGSDPGGKDESLCTEEEAQEET